MLSLGLKQFRSKEWVSYLVYDKNTKECAWVDPLIELMDDYRAYLMDQGLKPTLLMETRTRNRSYERFLEEFSSCRMHSGAVAQLGGVDVEAIETPGQSPEARIFKVAELLFTGDTLWIGRTAAPSSPMCNVETLWQSLQGILSRFDGNTIILPSHESVEITFSTLKTERTQNPDLRAENPQSLRSLKDKASRQSARPTGFATISVDKLERKLGSMSKGIGIVDVREPSEFSEGAIPGSINIPLSQLPLELSKLREHLRLYIYCQFGRRSKVAARTLDYIGLKDVVAVKGGYSAWVQAGLPVAKRGRVD